MAERFNNAFNCASCSLAREIEGWGGHRNDGGANEITNAGTETGGGTKKILGAGQRKQAVLELVRL